MAGLRKVHALLDQSVADRVIFDLGLSLRSIGYYTGAIFEVYDPAVGMPIGGGGRYDELLGRFGASQPAVGFALAVDRLHAALAGEERTGGESARTALAGEERTGGESARTASAATRGAAAPTGGESAG
jgi:ATP phosphoribosyltransferase regulatory subunit